MKATCLAPARTLVILTLSVRQQTWDAAMQAGDRGVATRANTRKPNRFFPPPCHKAERVWSSRPTDRGDAGPSGSDL